MTAHRQLIILVLMLVVVLVDFVVLQQTDATTKTSFESSTGMPDAFDTHCNTDTALVQKFANQKLSFPFRVNDRVSWIGSSSTYYGTWSNTLEFLLRTRHPELKLSFARHSTGSGTFEVGADRLPDWLERSKPTLVFFNYGANDSVMGRMYLNLFHSSLSRCVETVTASGARVVLMTHQPGDARFTMPILDNRRKHYAYDMLQFASQKNWSIVDLFHPMEDLMLKAQNEQPDFAANTDYVHLTDSAYVAWGFYLYERLNPPEAESVLAIDLASRSVTTEKNCQGKILCYLDEPQNGFLLSIHRLDRILPILPPTPIPSSSNYRGSIIGLPGFMVESAPKYAIEHGQDLPPRKLVPMEAHSKYMLKIAGLSPGRYSISCNGMTCGKVTAEALAAGVNLNSLLLDNNLRAPWSELALKIWDCKVLDELEGRGMQFNLTRDDAAKDAP